MRHVNRRANDMLRPRRKDDLRIAGISAVAVTAVVLCLHVGGASPSEDPMISKTEAIFAPLSDSKSPGLAVLVRKDDHTIFERGYGVRDLRTFTAIDPRTNFRLNFVRDLDTTECQIRGHPACNCSLWGRRFVRDSSAVRSSLSGI